MIKANELRIGNWIMVAGTGELHPVQVNINNLRQLVSAPEYAAAIPLTPEILEQCGFEEQDDYDSFYPTMTKGDFVINFAIHNGTIQYDGHRIIDTGGDDFLQDIMPLHKFQNLYFALTGEELQYNPEIAISERNDHSGSHPKP